MLPLRTLLQLTPDELTRTKVKFNNFNGIADPLEEYVRDPDLVNVHWLFWRRERRNFNVGDIALNLLAMSDRTWLLTTAKEVTKELGVKEGTNYEGVEIERLAPFFGRAIVRYHRTSRSGVRLLDSLGDLEVVQVLPAIFDGVEFPGYDRVRLSFQQLKAVLDRNKRDWVAALEGQKAVYLITDMHNGKHYVGSATGDNGMLLDRWRAYVKNGHGGNKELVGIVSSYGPEYVAANFQYSILENFNSRVDQKFVLAREKWWKEALASGTFGYNSN
ncbi:endonuclease [Nocardioides sp. Root140]|nr:endonuclease [Nocardioides sp. Root140]